VFFCKRGVPFFVIKQRWAPFLPGFSRILLGFLTYQKFGLALAPPASPPPTPLREIYEPKLDDV